MSKRLEANHRSDNKIRTLFTFLVLLIVWTPLFAQWPPLPGNRVEISHLRSTILGSVVDVTINLEQTATNRSFDELQFSILYDPNVLTVLQINQGALLTDCGWEYFDYQSLNYSPTQAGLKFFATADRPEISGSPTCLLQGQRGELVKLRLRVTSDQAYDCNASFIRFYWTSCEDNRLSSAQDDSVFISSSVCDWTSSCQSVAPDALPSTTGTPAACATGLIDGEIPSRQFAFVYAAADIICVDSIDGPGDLNLNGIGYEVADMVLYADYFLLGLSVLDTNPEQRLAQIAASDANQDGAVLTFQDLTFTLRVLLGDALPFPKPTAGSHAPSAQFIHNDSAKSVTVLIDADTALAGAWLLFSGEITPTFNVPVAGMDVFAEAFEHVNGTTRILLVAGGPGAFPSGLWFTYTGAGTLDSVMTADLQDNYVYTFILEGNEPAACGDGNSDGVVNVTDVILMVSYIFAGAPAPIDVVSGDIDCSGSTNINDAVYLIGYILGGGPAPCSNCP